MFSKTLSKKLIFQVIAIVAILALPSLLYSGSYIIADAPAPKEGVEMPPENQEQLSEGLLFIVLDGGRRDMMKNPELMPNLNSITANNGTYLSVYTNPLTMTASCVKEMATGIPSRPNEGLSNFHPEHPGTPDGWSLASSYDGDEDGIADNEFAIVGDYVWGDLYADNDDINFMKHRHGHADYMQGDTESFETLNSWLDGEIPASNTKEDTIFERAPNVIVAHLSGLDSTGHRYGSKDSA
jgi:predicted AlkP superfamily pyrophosphatase or phosphodiesterase